MRRPLLATLLLVPFVAAADERGAPAVDPCSLITAAEAEQVLGGKLKETPKPSSVERTKSCTFTFTDDKLALELWVFPASGLERVRDNKVKETPVTGLGSGAFLRQNPQGIEWIELFFRKGAITIEVTIQNVPGDREKVQALARKAFARL